MIKINYFDERELLVRSELETKAHRSQRHPSATPTFVLKD